MNGAHGVGAWKTTVERCGELRRRREGHGHSVAPLCAFLTDESYNCTYYGRYLVGVLMSNVTNYQFRM